MEAFIKCRHKGTSLVSRGENKRKTNSPLLHNSTDTTTLLVTVPSLLPRCTCRYGKETNPLPHLSQFHFRVDQCDSTGLVSLRAPLALPHGFVASRSQAIPFLPPSGRGMLGSKHKDTGHE
jgi:hypothetical protein